MCCSMDRLEAASKSSQSEFFSISSIGTPFDALQDDVHPVVSLGENRRPKPANGAKGACGSRFGRYGLDAVDWSSISLPFIGTPLAQRSGLWALGAMRASGLWRERGADRVGFWRVAQAFGPAIEMKAGPRGTGGNAVVRRCDLQRTMGSNY